MHLSAANQNQLDCMPYHLDAMPADSPPRRFPVDWQPARQPEKIIQFKSQMSFFRIPGTLLHVCVAVFAFVFPFFILTPLPTHNVNYLTKVVLLMS